MFPGVMGHPRPLARPLAGIADLISPAVGPISAVGLSPIPRPADEMHNVPAGSWGLSDPSSSRGRGREIASVSVDHWIVEQRNDAKLHG